ncbi:MAG: T9SS type A sorting domain-containing protein [Bacteroidetes bacterium]|nr:T9SS type A sorting domain-containing protein [Bacteroidota bacterium]
MNGGHLYNMASTGVIERYNFDRCTGLFSNRQIYSTPSSIFNNLWDFEISPDESKFYAYSIYQGAFQNLAYLLQFDFNNSNFIASADTLRVFSDPERPGSLKLAPDGKIYSSVFSNVPDGCSDYLYCSSTIDSTNSNLSVINFPDSLGSSCDFQPYSFYLGGHKAYYGLPNNPNYELDTLHGSPCDTLTSVGLNDLFPKNKELKLYYDKTWQTVFVNAEELQGRNATLEFYNINGQLMERISSETDGSYFSKSSLFSSQADGVYIVRLSTEKEVLVGKFVKW